MAAPDSKPGMERFRKKEKLKQSISVDLLHYQVEISGARETEEDVIETVEGDTVDIRYSK